MPRSTGRHERCALDLPVTAYVLIFIGVAFLISPWPGFNDIVTGFSLP